MTKDPVEDQPPQVDLHVLLAEVQQLKHCTDRKASKILQKLSSAVSNEFTTDKSTWRPSLIELLRLIASDGRLELQILTARVYLTIIHKVYPRSKFDNVIKTFLAMEEDAPCLHFHNTDFTIDNVDTFKLTIINGYLEANRAKVYSKEICRAVFEVLYVHCTTYTYHTYAAFKLLAMWLDYTTSVSFWDDQVMTDFQERMVTLIFSNWDNCISEVVRINTTRVFPAFMRIMHDRHPEFIHNARKHVIAQLSWRDPLKFSILTQVTRITHELPMESSLIQEVVRGLERAELKEVATELYVVAWGDMHEYGWLESYVNSFHPVVAVWERENNVEALDRLWELWLNPTLPKFCNNLVRLLWDKFFHEQMIVCQSYLVKLAAERGISLTALFRHSKFRFNHQDENQLLNRTIDSLKDVRNVWVVRSDTRVPFVLDDARECVRLNGFAVYCHGTEFKSEEAYSNFIADPAGEFSEDEGEDADPNYEICQWFLYHNAKTSRTMCEQIVWNVEILLQRICSDLGEREVNFLQWLYDFMFDCLEIGSCHQRKALGLRLCQILLRLIDVNNNVGELKLTMRQWKHLTQQTKQSFYILATLCTDPVGEIRERACEILVEHFSKTTLQQEENDALAAEAQRYCLSSKFHEVSGGVKLWRVITRRTQNSDPVILLDEARNQLSAVMCSLEAIASGAPFYDTLMIFSEISFDPRNDVATAFEHSFVQELTGLLEEAAGFFLKVSRVSEDVRQLIPAEIAVALDQAHKGSHTIDDLHLSPGHRDVLSAVWTSLKSICELAAKLAYIKSQAKETYQRLIQIVMSVLSDCRHKCIAEVAGNALVHLMNNKYLDDDYFLAPLEKLFSITEGSTIEWVGEGDREVFLLHQLLAHDEETTGALLRTIINRMVEFIQNSTESSNPTDKDLLLRQFRYLRTIVADETLHPVYAQYLEQMSLLCFFYFRSDDAALRTASSQLVSAMAERISGESKDGDLDFGTGYSLDHLYTHYPRLASVLLSAVKKEVAKHTKSLEIDEVSEDYDGSIEPVLRLLSRTSVAGGYFFEPPSSEYRREMMYQLMLLFAHPVHTPRELAAKAYAALTLPQRIAPLLLFEKTTDSKDDDRIFNHGSYMSQVYLQMRARYSLLCSREDSKKIRDGTNHQLDRLREMVNGWIAGGRAVDYVVEAMFLRCLLTSPELKHCDRLSGCSLLNSEVIREKIATEGSNPGFWEFLEHLVELYCFFFDVDECSARQLLEIFSRIDRYTVTVMKHLKNFEKLSTRETAENVEKFFNEQLTVDGEVYSRLCTLMEREEFVQEMSHKVYQALAKADETVGDYLTDVIEFIIRVMESGVGIKGVQMQEPYFDIVRLITKLINSTNYAHQKLGYRMIAITGDDFDDYGYKRKILEFLANAVSHEREKLWALDCLELCLSGKKFTSMDDVLQLKIVKCLMQLLNDPEIQTVACRKLMGFELIPRPSSVHFDELPRNPTSYLHDLLRVSVTSHALSQDQVYRDWLHDVVNCTTDSGSNCQDDDTYRESGKIVNVLTYLIRHVRSSSRDFPDVVHDKLNVTQIVKIGNRYQEEYIASQLNSQFEKLLTIFSIDVKDYLAHKKRILRDIIEERKKKCF